jgi:hypothetical protein
MGSYISHEGRKDGKKRKKREGNSEGRDGSKACTLYIT